MRRRFLLLALGASLCFGALPVVSAVAAVQVQPSVSSSAAVSGSAVVAEAQRFLGYPYSYTGDSPATGFSCIGFVWYVYGQLGESIPGTLGTAMAVFPRVSESALLPGDIIFFQNTWWAGVSHVAIYIGGGRIIHAENPQNGVTISSIVNDPRDGNYWQQHYLVAERPWSGSSGSPAPVHRPGHFLYVVAPSLNLRTGASMGDAVLTVLGHGAKLRVEGWAPGWVRVRTLNGTLGWVMRDGVANAPGYRTQPARHVIRHRFSPAVRHAAWASGKTIFVNGLNVRSAPSISASVITSVGRGARVGILSGGSSWDHVLLMTGATGWAEARFIGRYHTVGATQLRRRLVAGRTPARSGVNMHSRPSLAAPVVTVTNGARLHVMRWGARWVEVRLSTGTAGWMWREFLGGNGGTPASFPSTRFRRVGFSRGRSVTPDVRIHSGPSLAASVIGATGPGMRIRILAHRDGFAHIHTSSGTFGWISAQFLGGSSGGSSLRSGGSLAGPHARVTVRLHAQPLLTGRVQGLVYAGTHVTVLGSTNGWDRVRLPSGRTGYVDSFYIAG